MLQQGMSKVWRRRLTYGGMSLLVAWHTMAMVIAPAPESDMSEAAREIFHPYLTLFWLDNHWGFFAPDVRSGRQFRYVIEDATGKRHTFIPGEKLNRFHPTSIWIRDRYAAVMDYPGGYADAAAAALCEEHAALKPIAVTLLQLEQKDFLPRDRMSGKQPLDPEFVNVRIIKAVPCSVR